MNSIIGKRFGKLTVCHRDNTRELKEKEEIRKGLRKSTKEYYICKCDCGKEISVAKEKLNENRKSCGCHKKKYCFDDPKYIGRKYGDWTILEYSDKKFLCECKCGSRKHVDAYNLIGGYTKDCGCGRKKKMSTIKSKYSEKEIINKVFGRLTVISRAKNDKHGKKRYVCKCDCGNTVTVTAQCLYSGHTQSCGCLISKGNEELKKALEIIDCDYKSEYHVRLDNEDIPWMRFDAYVESMRLAIEFDGEQHFRPVDFGGYGDQSANENYEKTIVRDNIKRRYCDDNKITLLRIPYTEINNIVFIIEDKIDDMIANND